MNNLKNTGENTRNGVFNWILLVLAVLQSSSQLLGFFIQEETLTKPSLVSAWILLGNSISENWNTFSISLVLAVLGNFLYKRLYAAEIMDNLASKRGQLNTIFLTAVNIALCNKIYSSNSISEKCEYIKAHIPTAIVLFIIVLLGILAIWFIENERRITKGIESSLSPQPKDSIENDNTIKIKETILDAEVVFRMRYPISYSIRSFFQYTVEKRKLKYERRMAMLEAKTEIGIEKKKQKLDKIKEKQNNQDGKKPKEKLGNIVTRITTSTCSLALTILTIKVFISLDGSENPTNLYQSVQDVGKKLRDLTSWMDASESWFTEFLFTLGGLFLIAIVCFTIYLLFYILAQLTFYFVFHGKEDENRIKRCGKAIKVFVFSMIDGVMRLIIFIPDFLEHLEQAILGTDLDEKIEVFYPDEEESEKKSDT